MPKGFNPHAYGNPKATKVQTRFVPAPIAGDSTVALPPTIDPQYHESLDPSTFKPIAAIHDGDERQLKEIDETKIAGSNDMTPAASHELQSSRFAHNPSAFTSKAIESQKSFNQNALISDTPEQGQIHHENVGEQQGPGHTELPGVESKTSCEPHTQPYATPITSADLNAPDQKTNGALDNVSGLAKHENRKMTVPPSSRTASNRSQVPPVLNDKTNNQLTTEERVHQARAAALKRIKLRSKGKEKASTTSLRDLDLARTPVQLGTQAENQSITPQPAQSQYANGTGDRCLAPLAPSLKNTAGVPQVVNPVNSRQKGSQQIWLPEKQGFNEIPAMQETKNARWAHKADLKPVEVEVGSNAWGSSIASNASQDSKDSLQPLHSGKAVHSRTAVHVSSHPLAEWNGTMLAPPADWNDRPRFNNDSIEFHSQFAHWLDDVKQMTIEPDGDSKRSLPTNIVENPNNAADGISTVPRNTIINKNNIKRYGYHGEEINEVLKYVQPLQSSDFDDWGKIDLKRPENAAIKDETTRDLVSNWVKQIEARRKIEYRLMEQEEQAAQAISDPKPIPNPNRPKINVYLRPAISDDVPQMTDIYNWYVEHTPRPAEINTIEIEDMQQRLDDVRGYRLPFIVAIERDVDRDKNQDQQRGAQGVRFVYQSDQKVDPLQDAKFARERVIGWASAQDFTAADFVERVSVELEVYTDPAYRQLGIGRCLIDKLIESCDRGYLKRGGYPFHCPPEKTHLYSGGGGRDLVKLVFILRKWKYPKTANPRTATTKAVKENVSRKPYNQENDYDVWIKAWLETWGFEVEGVLKGAGAKHGRFVDVVHFGRETSWHPAEGRIPDPIPGLY